LTTLHQLYTAVRNCTQRKVAPTVHSGAVGATGRCGPGEDAEGVQHRPAAQRGRRGGGGALDQVALELHDQAGAAAVFGATVSTRIATQ
jgi:hypothetical protein